MPKRINQSTELNEGRTRKDQSNDGTCQTNRTTGQINGMEEYN